MSGDRSIGWPRVNALTEPELFAAYGVRWRPVTVTRIYRDADEARRRLAASDSRVLVATAPDPALAARADR